MSLREEAGDFHEGCTSFGGQGGGDYQVGVEMHNLCEVVAKNNVTCSFGAVRAGIGAAHEEEHGIARFAGYRVQIMSWPTPGPRGRNTKPSGASRLVDKLTYQGLEATRRVWLAKARDRQHGVADQR